MIKSRMDTHEAERWGKRRMIALSHERKLAQRSNGRVNFLPIA